MSVADAIARPARRRLPARCLGWLGAGALLLSLGCGGEEPATGELAAPTEPPAATTRGLVDPDAPERVEVEEREDGTVVARTITAEGEVFEAEYGREDQLPSDFPDDVPLYGNAQPLASMAAPEHGTVVNLRTADAPEQVFAWYREHYANRGWEIEQQLEERSRRTIVASKGNRVSSIVIIGVPGATQILLTIADDR